MNYLRYSSDEMFSSTELIRKSKMIFDKLNKKEVEKAIILRDGKPGFMLLDFATYEKIMKEYIELKEGKTQEPKEEYMSLDEIEVVHKVKEPKPSMKKVEAQIKAVESILEEAHKNTKENIPQESSVKEEKKKEITQIEQIQSDEINDEELQKALEEIEKMNLSGDLDEESTLPKEEAIQAEDDFEMNLAEVPKKSEKQPLKEFWD